LRQIRAAERAAAKRIYSAQDMPGRFHRPDLVLLDEQPEAIEVELTDKAALRLDRILRAWRHAMALRRIGAVHYLCSPRALPYVRRAVQRIRAEEVISVEPLETRDGRLMLGGRPLPIGRTRTPGLERHGPWWANRTDGIPPIFQR
jgi:hypothetical protein